MGFVPWEPYQGHSALGTLARRVWRGRAGRQRRTALAERKGQATMTAAAENCPDTGTPTKDKWEARNIVTELELTDEEEAMLMAKAAQNGLTFEEYIRTLLGYLP